MAAGVVTLILDSNPHNALPTVLGSHITPRVAMSVRGERERERERALLIAVHGSVIAQPCTYESIVPLAFRIAFDSRL
jgi:hypothetical protein